MWLIYKQQTQPIGSFGFNLSNIPSPLIINTLVTNKITEHVNTELVAATQDANIWAQKQISTLILQNSKDQYITSPIFVSDRTGDYKNLIYSSTIQSSGFVNPLYTCRWINES